MPGDDLSVTTAHLCDLAVKQGRAAVGIRSATILVDGAEVAVRSTHGSIASGSASALEAVLAARRNAGTKMAAISDDLCDRLTEAAKRYDQVDGTTSSALCEQLHLRQT
jgi:hypothetical protein